LGLVLQASWKNYKRSSPSRQVNKDAFIASGINQHESQK
jgi:hypothetical protein